MMDLEDKCLSRTRVLEFLLEFLAARKGCTPTEGSKVCAYYEHVL
jgi:hypothetical protein